MFYILARRYTLEDTLDTEQVHSGSTVRDAAVTAWIVTVVRHAAGRIAKREAARRSHELLVDESGMSGLGPKGGGQWEEALIARLDAERLCGQLRGKERVACLVWTALGPISERDLAKRLGVSQATAHRIRQRVAKKLKGV